MLNEADVSFLIQSSTDEIFFKEIVHTLYFVELRVMKIY